MRYFVEPGLYAAGRPDGDSPVLVTANYKLSFDSLRSSLEGIDAYILVLDTGGINVWCAAGKGTFGTGELVRRIKAAGLERLVSHRRVVLPQLGAPGISAHLVRKETGFRVSYGPVHAKDIPRYLHNGFRATTPMRKVRFGLGARLVLIPMEVLPLWKKFLVFAAAVLLLSGLGPEGILFKETVTGGVPLIYLGLIAVFSGTVLTPLLLPLLPFRSFSLKGLVAGIVTVAAYYLLRRGTTEGFYLPAAMFLFFPAVSSYLALNFTGASTFTNMSGVKKEVRAAVPAYIVSAAVSIVLFALYKAETWGII